MTAHLEVGPPSFQPPGMTSYLAANKVLPNTAQELDVASIVLFLLSYLQLS